MVFWLFGELFTVTVLWPGPSVWVVFIVVGLVGGTYTPAIEEKICVLVGENVHTCNTVEWN